MIAARTLNYTLADFANSETIYNLGLWQALSRIEAKEEQREQLKQDALNKLAENDGRFTRGIRI